MDEVDPKNFDGISDLVVFISFFFLFFSNDCIVIDGILLLFIMMGVPSSVNYHDMIYASYLSISSLLPDVNRKCSHV